MVDVAPTELTGAHLDPFRKARLRSAEQMPYLATALYALLPFRADLRAWYLCVDRDWRVYIDTERLRSWGIEPSAAVLLHEIQHLVRETRWRFDLVAAGLNPDRPKDDAFGLWNIITDAAINDSLLEAGIALPPGAITPQKLGLKPGGVEEQYWDRAARTLGIHADFSHQERRRKRQERRRKHNGILVTEVTRHDPDRGAAEMPRATRTKTEIVPIAGPIVSTTSTKRCWSKIRIRAARPLRNAVEPCGAHSAGARSV